MNLETARKNIGRRVEYQGAKNFTGVITSVGSRFVFVRYGTDKRPEATHARDLELLEEGPPAADPDRACPHENFAADVDVNRRIASDDDPTVIGFAADIRIACANCGERFRWIGIPAGLLAGRPTCSIDEFELHAPIRPATGDPDFGLGIPGYAVTYTESSPS